MASTSALLRSAESTRRKIRQQQDAEVAYEWSLSAKTYEDFLAYSKYLEDQAAKTTDPTDLLGYRKKIDSARRSYVSEEIGRLTNDVLNGRLTNSQKYEKMVDLFYMAYDNEDYSLAQDLNQQLDRLSVAIQKEYESAQRVTGTMALNGVKSLDALIKKMESGNDGVLLPDGTVVKPLSILNEEFGRLGKTVAGGSEAAYFAEVRNTLLAIRNVIVEAYNGSTTQEAADSILSKYESVLDGTENYKTAAGEINLQQVDLAARSAEANNPLYSIQIGRDPATGATQYTLKENQIDDFVWIRNDDGTFSATPTYTKLRSPNQTLETKITNEGFIVGADGSIAGGSQKVKADDSQTIGNRLASLGYHAEQNKDGTITLTTAEGIFTATIMPNGSVRFFGKPGQFSGGQAGLYEIDILSGGVTEVNPEDTSIFGVQSTFGGLLSQASDEGKRFIDQLAGVTKPRVDLISPLSRISLDQDFSGRGTQVFGSALQGTTNILQGSEIKREQQRQLQELQKAEAARALQRAEAFNLNQMPVGNMPNRALQVAPLPPQPKISIAPSVTPNTKVIVGNGPAVQSSLSVSNGSNTQRIVVPSADPGYQLAKDLGLKF